MKRLLHALAAFSLIAVLTACYGDTEPPSNVKATSATLRAWGVAQKKVPGTDKASTDFYFEYGTSTTFGQKTLERHPDGLEVGVRYPILEDVTGLTPKTRYYYRMCGKERDETTFVCANTHSFVTSIPASDYQHVTLASGAAEVGVQAISLAVLPNLAVVHTARHGTVRVTDADGNTKVAGQLNVYTNDEEGLQGVAADPNFATNRWLYLYYSPTLNTPGGSAPLWGDQTVWNKWKGEVRLSRFTLKADDTLDMTSEKIILRVETDRGLCCHLAGDIDFDAAGNLYLTTGDDTNSWGDADGFAPLDEREGRNPQYDAQRSSANTNDLRGKLLRIRPQPDGTYTIPSGNLFRPGTAKTRPEIYAMGFRNPFRMTVDKPTGHVYLGDHGPEAWPGQEDRGPQGQVEFNQIKEKGNYGWPYCTGTNTVEETYNEWPYPDGPGLPKYDCANGPANNSPNNTGLTTLPPAKPSWIKYGSAGAPPEFGDNPNYRVPQSPMGGSVYRYDPNLDSPVKFPASLDSMYFAAEFERRWIMGVAINPGGTRGGITKFPWAGSRIIDTAFGPDGALYVLDFGNDGNNNQALYRIEYLSGGSRRPIAKAAADRTSGIAPLTIAFSSAGSSDPEGGPLTYSWNFGDGGASTQANPSHTYTVNGTYSPTLTVRDPDGQTATASLVVTVGNTEPSVVLSSPANGQLFSFGDTVPFQVTVGDPEDGPIDCGRVKVSYLLGHDTHTHGIDSKNGCTGSITVPADAQHTGGNLYGVFEAEYTDNGGLTKLSRSTLQPRHRQAEHFTASAGIQVLNRGGAHGSEQVALIHNGDWISFAPYRLNNATGITARVCSGGPGGVIEVRAGSTTGTLLGTVTVPNTGGWGTYADVSAPLSGAPSGTTTLFLVFKSPSGSTNPLFDLDDFTFQT